MQGVGSGNPRAGKGASSDRGKAGPACSPAPSDKVSWLMIRNSGAWPLLVGMNPQQIIAPLGSDHTLRYFELLKQKELWELFFVQICSYRWALHACSLTQLCLTLCDPRNCSLPGSSVSGIFQARILECVAISSSRGSSQPRDGTRVFWVSYIGRQIRYHRATWEAPID